MLRHLVCSFTALFLVSVAVAVEEKPKVKVKTATGTFVSYKEGTLTLKVTGKKGEEPKATEFKVSDDIKTVTLSAEAKKEGTVKDAFKELKEGTAITLTLGEGDKVSNVQIGTAKKGEDKPKPAAKAKTATGTFVAFKDGTLTIKVKGKKGEEPKATEFKVGDDIKTVTLSAEAKKEGTAKQAFAELKDATPITITLGEGDKVTGVQIGTAAKKKGEDKPAVKAKTATGTFVSYKEGTLTIKVQGKKGEEPKATEFKVSDDIKTVTLSAEVKKEGTVKEAFKELKDATPITVTLGEGDKVTGVQIGTAKKKEK